MGYKRTRTERVIAERLSIPGDTVGCSEGGRVCFLGYRLRPPQAAASEGAGREVDADGRLRSSCAEHLLPGEEEVISF